MNSSDLAEKLFRENFITETSLQKIKANESGRFFSVNPELKTLLYAGVLLLTSGLGVAIYKNIDSIGHIVVILFIAALSVSGFAYCYMKREPYSNDKVNSPNIFFDYVLLLACLTLVSFIGYLQFEYSVFGDFNGLAFLLPAILIFVAAYYFDHIGVLSIAITCLAAFTGIAITPTSLLRENNFHEAPLIYSGLFLGAFLVIAGKYLSDRTIKSHFTFTYFNFAVHLLFICCLSGLFSLGYIFIFIPVLAFLVYACIRYANREKSFYFLLVAVVYGYIGLSYFFIEMLWLIPGFEVLFIYLGFFYFIGTSIYIIRFLKNYRKKFKTHADL